MFCSSLVGAAIRVKCLAEQTLYLTSVSCISRFQFDMSNIHSQFSIFLSLLIVVLCTGCDEPTLGPETTGEIKGQVTDTESEAPIVGANVTTSPPTQSILTDEDGEFLFTEVPTGDYTVEVTKSNYESRTVSVSVEEGQAANASILLEKAPDGGTAADSLVAEVVNWTNDRVNRDSTGADSVYVDVEYNVRNSGNIAVDYYELYFSIETEGGHFSAEVQGDSLDVDQRDVGSFRKYVRQDPAHSVYLDDTYAESGE